ncbi:phosphatidylserine decarboxylase [Marininema mesophilum]|uniref:Phosphatidylserine decarboxylase proenzyme n=1 Tax=Marininema mesophilum TaxID=1048340 RepID=A0A1H2VH46_9BACL|nr:archaetidylserine decarboxylase [Marininema mesophilum]SDW67641.1 phosphatidylserine decarboxylase [Marininema mesophilum]
MKEQLLITVLKALPKKTISRWMGSFSRTSFSRRFIPFYIKRFNVDISEAEHPVTAYPTLLDFFVRDLKEGVRPIDSDPEVITSPVDGAVSQKGCIAEGTMLQAKGVTYSLEALLAEDSLLAAQFAGGDFLTLYLSPRDYHRIHAPVSGKVTALTYVPGTLFPVNELGVQRVHGLFARNERLITLMDSPCGKVAVIKVGATNVGSIRVNYEPEVCTNHPKQKKIVRREYSTPAWLDKGEEMGRFEFGSTVILLFQKNRVKWIKDLKAGVPVRMGEALARKAQS